MLRPETYSVHSNSNDRLFYEAALMTVSKIRTILIVCLMACFLLESSAFSQKPVPDLERRINVLLAKMTLAEKLGQLQQLGDDHGRATPEELEMARKGLLGSTLGVRGAKFTNDLQRAALESRLKIPILFGFDVIHGY